MGSAPEKAKLRRWRTYLSQLQLSVHNIQGVKNGCADYISRKNFEDMIGARSEELGKEAFSEMDVHVDLNMTMIRPLDGLQQVEYLEEFRDIYKRLEKRLEPILVNQEQWKRDKTYIWPTPGLVPFRVPMAQRNQDPFVVRVAVLEGTVSVKSISPPSGDGRVKLLIL